MGHFFLLLNFYSCFATKKFCPNNYLLSEILKSEILSQSQCFNDLKADFKGEFLKAEILKMNFQNRKFKAEILKAEF